MIPGADSPATRHEAVPPEGGPVEVKDGATPFSVWRILWPIGLSLAVLAVIAAFTFDPDEMGRMVSGLDPWMMLLAVATVLVRVGFGGWRLSHVSHGRLNLAGGLRAQVAWDFASNITPSLVGGAPLAAMYVARDSKTSNRETMTVGDVGAFMMFVMLLDQSWSAIAALVVLAAAVFMEVIPQSLGSVGLIGSMIYLGAFMVWTILFGYGTLFRPEILEGLFNRVFRFRLLRRFGDRVALEMAQYRDRAKVIRAQPFSFYAKGLLLTAGTWIGRYLLAVFIIASVVPHLDLVLATMRSIAMLLGSLIFPTPGGAGGVEGLYVVFFGSLMPKAYVVPTLLIWRTLAYYVFVAMGIVLSTHQVQKSIRSRRRMPGFGRKKGDG